MSSEIDFSDVPPDVEQSIRERIDKLEAVTTALQQSRPSIVDDIEQLREENQQLKARIDKLEPLAEQAMVVASRGHETDTPKKTEIAKNITRNELVRRAAMGGPADRRPVTVTDIKQMALPDVKLAWKTIHDDAWADLRVDWPCFRKTTKDGQKALTVSRRDIPKALARAVEIDLDRDDLANQVVGGNSAGGGSR